MRSVMLSKADLQMAGTSLDDRGIGVGQDPPDSRFCVKFTAGNSWKST